MQRLVTGMQDKRAYFLSQTTIVSRGFTLIEILVVLLILGITLGFALLSFGDFGEKRRIITAAELFANYAKMIQQQAILETNTFGIRFTNNDYEVVRFNSLHQWQPLPSKGLFHRRRIPEYLVIQLKHSSQTTKTPGIIIDASGNAIPFQLNFGSKKHTVFATVVGQPNGNIDVQLMESP